MEYLKFLRGMNYMAQKKESLIKNNVLNRYEFNEKEGKIIVNDFLQLSNVVKGLKETDEKAYNTMLYLIKEKSELEEANKERGKRISTLQRNTEK